MSGKPVVVFGAGWQAELAAYYLAHEAGREIAAFTVDADYVGAGSHAGRPLVAFETLVQSHPPSAYDLVIGLGWRAINGLRAEKFVQARTMGYHLPGFVSASSSIWEGMPPAQNLLIYERCILQPFSQLRDNVTLRPGAILGHHSTVGGHSFVASGAVTGGNVIIGERCFIGLGAVLRDGIAIADRCFIGAGAVVIADTDPDGVYVGNPARRLAKRSHEVTGG